MKLVFCSVLYVFGRITPRKFDMVPACDTEGPVAVTSDPSSLTLNRRGTRTSFTFRRVRRAPCDCCESPLNESLTGEETQTYL